MATATKGWVKICPLDRIPEGKATNVFINGQRLVMTRHDNRAYFLQGYCSHMLFYFKDAKIENAVLTCSLHNSQFDVRTGEIVKWTENVSGKMLEEIKVQKRLRTFAARIQDSEVYLEWPTDNPAAVRVRF